MSCNVGVEPFPGLGSVDLGLILPLFTHYIPEPPLSHGTEKTSTSTFRAAVWLPKKSKATHPPKQLPAIPRSSHQPLPPTANKQPIEQELTTTDQPLANPAPSGSGYASFPHSLLPLAGGGQDSFTRSRWCSGLHEAIRTHFVTQ